MTALKYVSQISAGIAGIFTLLVVGAFATGTAITTRQIAFQSNRNGNWDIYRLDISRGITFNLPRSPSDDLGPAYSPETQQIAFYSDRLGNTGTEIYIMDVNGGNQHPVKSDPLNHAWRPTWSPDGREIAYLLGYNSIRVLDALNGKERELTYGFGPAWSPTGQGVAYYADYIGELISTIYVVNTDGSNPRNLSEMRTSSWDPAWSPDGTQIAFVSSRTGNPEIYVMDVSCDQAAACDGAARRLTFSPTTELSPAWSPDGSQIAFVSDRDGHPQLYLMDANGDNPHALTAGNFDNLFPAWVW